MDNFIAKPFKRFLLNSADYAKKQISDYYNIQSVQYSADSEAAVINMTELKSITRNSTNNFTFNNNNSDLFDNSVNTNNSLNLQKKFNNSDVNKNELSSNNNNVKVVKAKIIEQPAKNVVKYFNLNNKTNLSGTSELDNIEIANELNKSNQDIKKTLPLIKIKVKFTNKKSNDNQNIIINETSTEPIIDEIKQIDHIECEDESDNILELKLISEITTNIAKSVEIETSKFKVPPIEMPQNFEHGCIFNENKMRPLSPIPIVPSPASKQFRPVEELIDFHEKQVQHVKPKSPKSKTLPRMGTSALYNRSPDKKNILTDQEIISALVHDRFIVNLYESRSYRRRTMKAKKSSTYGRIYKSLEREVASNDTFDKEQFENDIIRIQQSSPIKLKDQFVSFSPKTTIQKNDFNVNNEDTFILNHFPENISNDESFDSQEKEQFNYLNENFNKFQIQNDNLDENKFMHHLNLHNEKSSSNKKLFKSSIQQINKHETLENENIVDAKPEYFDELIAINYVENHFGLNEIAECIPETRTRSATSNNLEETVYPESNYSLFEEACTKSPQIMEEITEIPSVSNIENEASSYNMEEFLKKALGEELIKYDSHSDSTIIEIEPTGKEEEKERLPENKKIFHEESICTSDASDLISKINTFQSNFYRSLTKKLQNMSDTLKMPSAPKQEKEEKITDELELVFPNNEQVTVLIRQAAVQYEAMKQITKALTLCRNTKEFSASSEQVEGERLLLVATYKRQAILDEIRRLDYEIEEESTTEKGTVLISAVTLPLKEESTEQLVTLKREQNKWYVCIFSCGQRVVATLPTAATIGGIVQFSEEIVFTELPSDFSINVEVYCLIQRRPGRNFSHESKYHINKNTKNKTHCPSPKKFLAREKVTQKIPARFDTGIRASSFKSCGSLKLRVADLSKQSPWNMRKLPLCSVLNGSVSLNLQSFVQIPVKFSGFLTIGSEAAGCTNWNRRWCILDGHKFRYWNDPCDEDTYSPLRELDLKCCANARIETANRALCARPRTLILETTQPSNCEDSNSMTVSGSGSLKRIFLSADTLSDLNLWKTHLNIVVRALRTWNVGYCN